MLKRLSIFLLLAGLLPAGAMAQGICPTSTPVGQVMSATSYTLKQTDYCNSEVFTSNSPIAVSLPAPGTAGGFQLGYWTRVFALGSGTVTVTPTKGPTNTPKINGTTTLAISTGNSATIYQGTDGNWYANLGGSGGGGSGTACGTNGVSGQVCNSTGGSDATWGSVVIGRDEADGGPDAVTIRSGTSTTGFPGDITVASGDGTRGGRLFVNTGAGSGLNGGSAIFTLGSDTTTGVGGSFQLNTGDGLRSGNIELIAGLASSNDGGSIHLNAGDAAAGAAGSVTINAGNSAASGTSGGAAGGIRLIAGAATDAAFNSGDVIIEPGGHNSTGKAGDIFLTVLPNSNNVYGRLIISHLPTASPCATAPAGTIWANSNVLTVCP